MDTLAQIFGSAIKVKLIRLFLFNPDTAFSLHDVIHRVKEASGDTRKELTKLIAAGIVKRRSVVAGKVHELGYSLDKNFLYLQALKNLLITVSLHADETLVKKFNSVGKIKVFVASGVFIQEWDTRIDLLIAGDDLNMVRLDAVMKTIEAEVGKEISYSAFQTEDFEYRLGIHDKLIRDILDAPHTVLVDKIGIK